MDELDNFDDEVDYAENNFNRGGKEGAIGSSRGHNHGGEQEGSRQALRDIQEKTHRDKKTNGDDSESEPLQRRANEGDDQRPKAKEMALGLHEGISNFDYHAGGGISSTQLKQELKASAYFHAYDIGELKFEPTKQMRIGTAVHCLTLEPFDFDNQIALLPKNCQGNAKDAKVNKIEFIKANPRKDLLPVQDMDAVKYMRDALLTHPEASELLKDPEGDAELSGYYRDKDPETGTGTNMLLKFRPDRRLDWCHLDIKSTVDASEDAFTNTIGKFGYDISAAHYLMGDKILTGADHDLMIFLAVESSPPWLVAVYEFTPLGLEVGQWRRRKALWSIAQCRKKQKWAGINDDKVKPIGVPNYLSYKMREDS